MEPLVLGCGGRLVSSGVGWCRTVRKLRSFVNKTVEELSSIYRKDWHLFPQLQSYAGKGKGGIIVRASANKEAVEGGTQ